MDTRPPHGIVPEDALPPGPEGKRFVKLTDAEYDGVKSMAPEERHAWLRKNIPTKERLAMHLESLGETFLAEKAREGWFSDFESKHEQPKVLLCKKLRERALFPLLRLVEAGEYDDTKAESDAWAKKQTGETKRIIDAMTPRMENGL